MVYTIIISIKFIFTKAKCMSNASSSSTVPFSGVSNPSCFQSHSLMDLIQEYTETLNPFEKQGLAIAKQHLGPSFDMKRSSGFVRWKDSKKTAS